MITNKFNPNPYSSNLVVGYGKSHSSFGEIAQGRLSNGKDFLVTLPIDMWSICNLTCVKRNGPLVINCEYFKSKKIAARLLEKLDITDGYELTISFSRNIPIGKGLSSSTADMLSTVRALQEIFGFLLRNNTISKMFTSIEPHDGLMHKSSVIYNHRSGTLLNDLLYVPEYWIIAVDLGGHIDTIHFNKKLAFTGECLESYDNLYDDIIDAFNKKDDIAIAECATKSTQLYLRRNADPARQQILDTYKKYGSIGVQNTHSGTCIGLLFPKSLPTQEIVEISNKVQTDIDFSIFVTNTLKLLN